MARNNQKCRTRKDLLTAAAKLIKQNHSSPSLEEVAEEAQVSRATAYRYFPRIDILLNEASLDAEAPNSATLFMPDLPNDPVSRVTRVDTAFHEMIVANETSVRRMLIHSLQRTLTEPGNCEISARQNRRTPLIEAALEPAKRKLKPAALKTLTQALALIVGTEAMIVCKDVLQLDDAQTRRVKRWAIQALIEQAMSAKSRS